MSETTDLQNDILTYWEYLGIFGWHNNTGAYFRNNRMIKYGYEGSPDLIGIMQNGRFIGCETKIGKDKLREKQIIFHRQACRNNALIFTARTMKEVEARMI